MELATEIDYYGSGVTVFDPQKVLDRLLEAFPTARIECQDLAQAEVDSLITFLDTKQVSEPRRSSMLRQIRDKAARTGPVYRFYLDLPQQGAISGKVGRYHVTFLSDTALDIALELPIARFLLSLHSGVVRSNTETSYFRVPHPEYPGYWVLGADPLPPAH